MESQRTAEQVHSAPPKLDIFKNCIYSSSQAQGQYLGSMAMMRILSANRDSEVFTSISVTFPPLNIFVNIFFLMKIFIPY